VDGQGGKSASVAVSFVGKLKTTAQMVSIVLLLYFNPARQPADCGDRHVADLGGRAAHPGVNGVYLVMAARALQKTS